MASGSILDQLETLHGGLAEFIEIIARSSLLY